MAELKPMPMATLVRRMMREIDRCDSCFDLPLGRCFFGSPGHDLSVRFHGRRASTPLGPAAGPHSQMAQNIVLAWLGGSRIIELKTVQVNDRLEIPRPCIDMRTVGYNIEWSQELRLAESAEEYVKAAMLIEMLKVKLADRLTPGFDDTIFDMSVGYDLKGIQSPTVSAFLETMQDASSLIEQLRSQIPQEYSGFADLDFPSAVSRSLTLSTFHGCPPDEIERILEHLMQRYSLDVVVKLNPTLLGPVETRRLLNDVMGYTSIHVPDAVFQNDTTWEQAVGFVGRLDALADRLGVGFGVKLSNTLCVEHHGDFFPSSESQQYLSGQPLHVLAMNLVGRFRKAFGPKLPISFSAGIDSHNFADAVALGLTPITVCTDLLRPKGYARQAVYFASMLKQMDELGATTIEAFITGRGGCSDINDAILGNTERYVQRATADPRYSSPSNSKPPKKIGSSLELFNCITCDKCIPVCPNDANFRLMIPTTRVPRVVCRVEDGSWVCEEVGEVELTTKHQIANYADFCNECGNCDVFCPEDGGPYVIKPRFFGSIESFHESSQLDGFVITHNAQRIEALGRIDGRVFSLSIENDLALFSGDGFEVSFSFEDPKGTIRGRADEGTAVDLTYAVILNLVQRAALDDSTVNCINAAQ
ncbi:MAG TPA: glutamate synthase [Phycisphaerales bacterium]|nr:glutamate synthase [Phycisphaerales bacterium]